MCMPLLISPCTIKSRSSLLAQAQPGDPGKRAVKWLWFIECAIVISEALMLARVTQPTANNNRFPDLSTP